VMVFRVRICPRRIFAGVVCPPIPFWSNPSLRLTQHDAFCGQAPPKWGLVGQDTSCDWQDLQLMECGAPACVVCCTKEWCWWLARDCWGERSAGLIGAPNQFTNEI